jgi:aspartyl-tRNA(Asn)/glutamyl-tRNA(Gln) amidotransferase subunit B
MDEGSMRADVNVSVRKAGDAFGTRTETKNVNSVRFIMQAVEVEAKRQVEVIEAGGSIVQETRLFDPGTGTTRSMRSKEDAHDYRYFPDPDLLPVEFDDAYVADCLASLPELPVAKRARYTDTLGISAYNAAVLTADVETARYFEAVLAGTGPALATAAANWVTSELFGALKKAGTGIEASPVSPRQAAELLRLIGDGKISNSIGKQVLEAMVETGDDPAAIVEARGLQQVSDTGAIDTAIAAIIAANADKVAQYKAGKDALFGFFVGQTMKAMAGKANPGVVNERLKAALG